MRRSRVLARGFWFASFIGLVYRCRGLEIAVRTGVRACRGRDECEPVTINASRSTLPWTREVLRGRRGWKILQQLRPAAADCAVAEFIQDFRRGGGEVIAWLQRVSCLLAAQKAANVAAILPEERHVLVLGMPLEAQEETAPPAYEGVRAGGVRGAENRVARRTQRLDRQVVPARVRQAEGRCETGHERMPGNDAVPEHAEQFLRKTLPLDAVEVQHRRVRGETRADAGGRIGICPFQHLHEPRPVRLLGERAAARLHAGDDQGIWLSGLQLINVPVAARGEVLASRGSARHLRQVEK